MAKTAKKKPAPKKHSEKLLQPVISGNKTGGYYARALLKHKDHKKASAAYDKMARELSDETGEVDPVKLRHHLDSGFGGMTYRMRNNKKVGKVSTWRSDLKIHHANFLKAYDPTAHAVAEGTEMAGKITEGKYSHLPHDQKPFHTRGTALRKALKQTISNNGDTAHVPALASGAVAAAYGGLMGGPVGAAALGAGSVAATYALDLRAKYKHLRQTRQEEVEPFLQGLIDQGFPEEELEKIINEENAMDEHRVKLLDAILEDKPHDAAEAMDALLKDKLSTMLEDYKVGITHSMFNDGGDDEDEDETEDDDGMVEDDSDDTEEEVDEEIDLSHLTDEELQAILDEPEYDEDEDLEEEDDESGEEVAEGAAWKEFRKEGAKTDSPPKAGKLAVKALAKGAKNILKGKK